jgi:polysaccharide export outer membrane protein
MTRLFRSGLNLALLAIALVQASCFTSQPVPYFGGGVGALRPDEFSMPEQTIEKGDILDITIMSDNPEATSIYNQAGGAGGVVKSAGPVDTKSASVPSSQGQKAGGYLVENDGCIIMHTLGRVHAEGLTRRQLSESIVSKLQSLNVLANPYCVIRNNSFKVTVLGEVASPGVFNVPSEKASVLEALGMAGDINDYGRKENVMLIRESMGKRTYHVLDLTDPSIFRSPNFYLRHNDVLVVQADKRKPTGTDQQMMQILALSLSVVTSISVLVNLFR